MYFLQKKNRAIHNLCNSLNKCSYKIKYILFITNKKKKLNKNMNNSSKWTCDY